MTAAGLRCSVSRLKISLPLPLLNTIFCSPVGPDRVPLVEFRSSSSIAPGARIIEGEETIDEEWR